MTTVETASRCTVAVVRWVLVLALILAAFPGQAAAGPDPAAGPKQSRADLRAAKKHFRAAEVHYRRSNFALALESFKEALRFARRPSIILNIAQCYRQLGEGSRAVLYYRLYLSEWEVAHPGTPPKFEAEVQRHIDALTQQQQGKQGARQHRPEPRPGPSPRTAQPDVMLDQEIVPAALDEPAAAASSSTQGALFVFASPEGAAVWADGRQLGTIRGGELELGLAPGKHALRVQAQGYTPWKGSMAIEAAGTHRLEVELAPAPPEPSLGWLVAAIGTSGIAIGAEITALVYTVKANREFKRSTQFGRFKDAAIASHILAASFAAGTVVCWWLYYRSIPSPEQPRARFSFAPLTGGAYVGAALSY